MKIKAILFITVFLLSIPIMMVSASEIIIEDANTTWDTTTAYSPDMTNITSNVTPRILVEYANNIYRINLTPSTNLLNVTNSVTPRILTEYANTIYRNNLTPSTNLLNVTNSVTPRILVEYANSIYRNDLKDIPTDLANLANEVSSRIIIEYANSNYDKQLNFPEEPINETTPPENHFPITNAHGPYSANINEHIQFYGSGTDPDGDTIIAYAWDFNGDNITDSTLQNPTYSWSSAGTYYPTLKVQDEKGAWSLPDDCTVLITTPLSYDGTLSGVYPQPHYSTGETVNIGVDIKNTGNSAETYDLHLVVHDKHDALVYDDTIGSISLSSGAKTSEEFAISPLSIGHFSFIAYLNSSNSGSVYDDMQSDFKVLDTQAILIAEDDADSLMEAAHDELDEMVFIVSDTTFETIKSLTWDVLKDALFDTIIGKIFTPRQLTHPGMDLDPEDIAKACEKLVNAGDELNEVASKTDDSHLKNKLREEFMVYAVPEKIAVERRDNDFVKNIIDKPFTRNDKIIQLFNIGRENVRSASESAWFTITVGINGLLPGGERSYYITLQEERDLYESIKKAFAWVSMGIVIVVLIAAVLFAIGTVGFGVIAEIPFLITVLKAFFVVEKAAFAAIVVLMLITLPNITPEVPLRHDTTLDAIESVISHQTTSTASVLSITSTSQLSFDKEAKITIAVDKSASRTSEPIIRIVVSPDGRIIDMNLHQTNPYTSNYETLSSSLRLPHQPGKYKILAMTSNDIMKSSVKQVETTQTAPNISVSISTDKQFYNSTEIVTITANFTNAASEKLGNLTFSIDILNTTYNNTGFLEINANSSKIETLSFVPVNNGTYKATVTLFAGLYIVGSAETGFTVENGTGVSVNIDSKEVYDPSVNVTANFTVTNIGTELYQGNIAITTVDTLNDYLEVYNSIEPLSFNESEEKDLVCIILPKEGSIPSIYRSYLEIDNSTYIVPFTVAANGTIFITVQTDMLIYLSSESVNVNISVKDVAFNATNATLNLTLTDPNGNKTYFDVTGSYGNYSMIISPDNKSVNGTYNILVNGTKDGYRVYSDQTFFIVNERTKLRCDIPHVIQLNTTDTINLFVETDSNQTVKDAFVRLTGCGFNETRTTDENGLVVFGTGSMNKTGVIEANVEKGGYGSFIGKMEIISKNEPPIAECFIATAAYGTPLHEDIDVLRDFRDEYLMTNPIGRTFVEIYYTTSPPIADVIKENKGVRTVIREGLVKPLVYISRVFVG
ncbi:MAG: hypothetical protein LAKADJCE_00721 [Candidatus Argoarchaeum ethanivorans]|uniref:PKD domain-containing protein n=1 Tax=Candidatus Argoarchaeum ethanivorans TaxID=2608793 RepID=A0A811TF84_9EURY|nr:MAG: hypothetical protein LAKADJCE_00721 [Candidatus Argoarchaeum ethanivorans]